MCLMSCKAISACLCLFLTLKSWYISIWKSFYCLAMKTGNIWPFKTMIYCSEGFTPYDAYWFFDPTHKARRIYFLVDPRFFIYYKWGPRSIKEFYASTASNGYLYQVLFYLSFFEPLYKHIEYIPFVWKPYLIYYYEYLRFSLDNIDDYFNRFFQLLIFFYVLGIYFFFRNLRDTYNERAIIIGIMLNDMSIGCLYLDCVLGLEGSLVKVIIM